jgi:tetratricopeptide (TPR) repeat protein
MRYFVFRFALFLLLCASAPLAPAQESSSNPASQIPPGTAQAPEPKTPESEAPASSASASPRALSSQVAAAEAAIVKFDWKSAASQLDAWLAAHPADPRALFDAGYVADNLDQVEEAAAFYRRATNANPSSFEAHLSLGLLLARQNNLDDARTELAVASHLDPGDAGPAAKAQAWRALARIDSKPDPTLASTELIEALKLTPETTADSILSAHIAENAGEPDVAEAAYRRVLAKEPGSAAATSDLVHLLIALQKYPAAETLLRDALQKSPDDPALNAQLATVLVGEDKADALPLIQKLHDQHPNDDAITRMLARILADAGDFSGSDHLYLALLKASPDDPALFIAHGQNLIRQLQYAPAFAAFDKATQLDPANGDAWSGLAFAASRTNQPAVTVHALTMRSKYLPELPSTYFLWATAYDNLHQKEQAAAYYHRFLDTSAGKFPDQEWQARQRIKLLDK